MSQGFHVAPMFLLTKEWAIRREVPRYQLQCSKSFALQQRSRSMQKRRAHAIFYACSCCMIVPCFA
jgi:hypothetical protein